MKSWSRVVSNARTLSTAVASSGKSKIPTRPTALTASCKPLHHRLPTTRSYTHSHKPRSSTQPVVSGGVKTPAAPEGSSGGVVDFLSDHGGKVAFVALSIAGYLIYSYYLSIQEKSKTEANVENRALIEPYEVLQLRYANQPLPTGLLEEEEESAGSNDWEAAGLDNTTSSTSTISPHQGISFDDFTFLLQYFQETVARDHTPLTTSYQSFVQRVEALLLERHAQAEGISLDSNKQDVIVVKDSLGRSFSLPRLQQKDASQNTAEISAQRRRPFQLIFGSLLDRMVYQKVCMEMNQRLQQGMQSGDVDDTQRPGGSVEKRAYYEVDDLLQVDWFLSLLLLVLPRGFNYGRCHATWQLLTTAIHMQTQSANVTDIELSGRNAMAGFHEEEQVSSNGSTAAGTGTAIGNTATSSAAASNSISEVSREDILHAISLLQSTDQIPPEKQVMETAVKYPIRLYKRRQPNDLVELYEKNVLKLPESSPSKKEIHKQRWTEDDFHKLLQSTQICAWAMCYKPNND